MAGTTACAGGVAATDCGDSDEATDCGDSDAEAADDAYDGAGVIVALVSGLVVPAGAASPPPSPPHPPLLTAVNPRNPWALLTLGKPASGCGAPAACGSGGSGGFAAAAAAASAAAFPLARLRHVLLARSLAKSVWSRHASANRSRYSQSLAPVLAQRAQAGRASSHFSRRETPKQ
jgi:hypothetical protein